MGWLQKIQGLFGSGLESLGKPRLRRSLAQLSLAFFAIVYFLVWLQVPGELSRVFGGLFVCYLVAFLAVGAEWFWARWYASGLGWSGMMVGAFSLVLHGWVPALAFYGGMHAVVVYALRGRALGALFEGQTEWREKYKLDEHGVTSLGKTITRASASLPALLVWALGPKEAASMDAWGNAVAATGLAQHPFLLAVPVLVLLGIVLLIRARSVGVLVLLAGAAIGLLGTLVASPFVADLHDLPLGGDLWDSRHVGIVGLAFLVSALGPLSRPTLRYLRGRQG